jgi:hypothetical protein
MADEPERAGAPRRAQLTVRSKQRAVLPAASVPSMSAATVLVA